MIVAWRVFYLLMLGREKPDLPCDLVFESCEWKSVYKIVKRGHIPEKAPELLKMIEMIASFGGYLGRKYDAFPGPKALWIGLQRTKDFALAWQAFGPE